MFSVISLDERPEIYFFAKALDERPEIYFFAKLPQDASRINEGFDCVRSIHTEEGRLKGTVSRAEYIFLKAYILN